MPANARMGAIAEGDARLDGLTLHPFVGVHDLFDGDRGMVLALGGAFTGLAAEHLTRGVLSGLGRFGWKLSSDSPGFNATSLPPTIFCSAPGSLASASPAPANRDILVESSGIKVVVDPKSALYVTGSELDFSDALQGGGFKVTNPNAATSCSCGESFSA